VIDLLVVSVLQKLSVTIGVLHNNSVPHGECHQRLVELQHPLLGKDLKLAERYGLSSGALNDLLHTKCAVLSHPPLDELLGVVRVEAEGSNVVLRVQDVLVEVVVDVHHVENGSLHDDKRPLLDKFLVLHAHGAVKLAESQGSDV